MRKAFIMTLLTVLLAGCFTANDQTADINTINNSPVDYETVGNHTEEILDPFPEEVILQYIEIRHINERKQETEIAVEGPVEYFNPVEPPYDY